MRLKFDGKYLKKGSTTLANFDGSYLKKGSSSGGTTLGNVRQNGVIRSGSSTGGSALCNILDGKYIRQGSSRGGKQLIKLEEAAEALGTTSTGPSTALAWYFFLR